jgi:ADP-heptose:LPS heptosyltransferase
LSPLGDTIFATPAIRALRKKFSQARIVVLTSPVAAQVLKHNPWRLEIKTALEKWDLVKCLTQIRKEKFDMAVSLSQLGGFFTRFCATPIWSDFTLITVQADRSVVQMCQDVLRVIDISSDEYQTEFWYDEQAERATELFLRDSSVHDDRPLIAVHAGGHYFIRKRWPLANFIESIQYLTKELGLRVILIGGQEDVEDALMIKSIVPEVISSVGMLKLTETAALLKRSCLFIGNDSGPLHLAAALDIPTIGLFGPTAPCQFYPYQAPRHTYIYKALSCSPCYRFGGGIWQYLPRCTKAYCMQAITVQELIMKVMQTLFPVNQEQRRWHYAGRP